MPEVDAEQSGPAPGRGDRRRAAYRNPLVLVAMYHPTMRARTAEVLECSCGCRVAGVAGDDATVADGIARYDPDVVVLDTGVFPGRFESVLGRFPAGRVIVVGPEPDDSYRNAALSGGAGGWIPRDRVGEDLGAEVCRVLACPDPRPVASEAGPSSRSGSTA